MPEGEGRTSSNAPARGSEVLSGPVHDYLASNSYIYSSLVTLRHKGWENPQAERYFQHQRRQADEADPGRRSMFNQMVDIMDKLQNATGAVQVSSVTEPAILDICMAPGGFTKTAFDLNPHARVSAITLPTSLGGIEVFYQRPLRFRPALIDITMIATEFDTNAEDIPSDHADVGNFNFDRPFLCENFDLVFCGGLVLRANDSHRPQYRDYAKEWTRLICAELVLAFQRIKADGTLIILLRQVESWNNVKLLHTMDKIAKIQLFKPAPVHAKNSSFYLVAQNVQVQSEIAVAAVKEWKRIWRTTTFSPNMVEDTSSSAETGWHGWPQPSEDAVRDLLDDFGPRLVDLGNPIWEIQRDALGNAEWIR